MTDIRLTCPFSLGPDQIRYENQINSVHLLFDGGGGGGKRRNAIEYFFADVRDQ